MASEEAPAVIMEDLPKKPPNSAYMIFLSERRASVVEDGKAEGKRLTAANVASILGKVWKEMSEDEKNGFKTKHQAAKEAYVAALKERGLDESMLKAVAAGSAGKSKRKNRGASGALPEYQMQVTPLIALAPVKRIIALDPDVDRTAAEAAVLIAKTTELFMHNMAQKAFITARLHKRGVVKTCDFYQTIKDEPDYEFLTGPMPLPEEMTEIMAKADQNKARQLKKQKRAAAANTSPAGKNQKKKTGGETQAITAMFGKMTELSEDYRRSPKKTPSKARRSRFQSAPLTPADPALSGDDHDDVIEDIESSDEEGHRAVASEEEIMSAGDD